MIDWISVIFNIWSPKRPDFTEEYDMFFNRIFRRNSDKDQPSIPMPESVSQQELLRQLDSIPYWEDKIKRYNCYSYCREGGNWELGSKKKNRTNKLLTAKKVNYGCGNTILKGWLNVDLFENEDPDYQIVDLLNKHPFADNSISYGYSEDMLEHLTQAQSIFVLSEIYRSLKPNGIMRFSFPGLEGVLNRHYTPATEERVREGEFEAYSFWDHIHFYSKDEIRLVAKHIGFKNIKFCKFGKSTHDELKNRETRMHQIELNTCVELQK